MFLLMIFRNLRIITSSLELIEKSQNDNMDEKALKFFNFAIEEATWMRKLINSLLEIYKITNDKVLFASIDMNEVMEKALIRLEKNISETKAQISHSPLPNVRGNESLIITLFHNIISNGIKYHKSNKPVIDISFKEDKENIEFCISDNGIGIDEKDFDRIFIVCKRLHSRTEYPGLGVGLTVCKNIVNVHEGKIRIESEIDKGSKFFITLNKVTANSLRKTC